MTTESLTPTPKSSNDQKRPNTTRRTSKPKKRKSKRKVSGQRSDWFEINNIIDERDYRGRRQCLVDWKGTDPATGRPYDATWESEKNVTEDAIYAWRQIKRVRKRVRAVLDETSPEVDSSQLQDDEAAQPARDHRRRHSRRGNSDVHEQEDGGARKRRRFLRSRFIELESQDIGGSGTSGVHSSQAGSVAAQKAPEHLQTNFVIALPEVASIDRTEFLKVSLSQSSQATGTERGYRDDESSVAARRPVNLSQRTIPDSQELSGNSLTESTSSGSRVDSALQAGSQNYGGLVEPDELRVEDQSTASTRKLASTSTEIPSHQPVQGPSLQGRLNSGFATGLGSTTQSESTSLPHPEADVLGDPLLERSTKSASIFDHFVFQSQLPFDLDDVTPTNSDHSQAGNNAPIGSPDFEGPDTSQEAAPKDLVYENGAAPSQHSSQAAQIVQNLLLSRSQSAGEFSVYDGNSDDDDNDIIPGTVSLRPGEEVQNSQNSSQALSELDGNTRNSSSSLLSRVPVLQVDSNGIASPVHIADQSTGESEVEGCQIKHSASWSQRPAQDVRQVNSTNMDDTSTASTPMSARERLRRIREASYRQINFDATRLNAGIGTADAPTEEALNLETALDLEQPVEGSPALVSPSTLLPSVETDQNEAVSRAYEALPNELLQLDAPVFDGPSLQAEHIAAPAKGLVAGPAEGFSAAPAGDFNPGSAHDFNAVPPAAYDAAPADPPTTLDPSALSLLVEGNAPASPSILSDDMMMDYPYPQVPLQSMSKSSENTESQEYPSSLLPLISIAPNEYLVTLPLASSIRPQYTEVINEASQYFKAFNAAFTVVPHREVDVGLVEKIDDVFIRLFDLCDLPPFLETLPSMSPDAITKHVKGSNSKLAFVGEFLDRLRHLESQKKVLILTRPGQVFDLINNIVRTGGYRQIRSNGKDDASSSGTQHPTVMVYSTADDMALPPKDFDIVIGYDHTFDQELLPARDDGTPLKVLTLVTTASIQHINMRIRAELDPLKRKHILLAALWMAREAIEEPDHGFPHEFHMKEPHAVAELFANYMETADEDDFYWEPQELPEGIFDIYASSQGEPTQSSNGVVEQPPGRKRSHDEVDVMSSKRAKTCQPPVVSQTSRIKDSVRSLIGGTLVPAGPNQAAVIVPVQKLETLSTRILKLEAELQETRAQRESFRELSDRTKQELDSWVTSLKKIQPKYMVALKDRGTFQAERDAARKEANVTSARLESAQDEIDALKKTNATLERKLGEANESLLTSANPELAKMARLRKDNDNNSMKITALEKKVTLAENEVEFFRDRFQQASQGTRDLIDTKADLKRQVEELSRKASDNIVKVNKIQAQSEARELTRMLNEQTAIVRDRDNELNRVKAELRSAKNGRRETRQSSVPQSPRMGGLGVLSPRNAGRNTSAAVGAPSSRGTSPAAPPGVFDGHGGPLFGQQPGNGRFAHLRD
ncbi:uncharacterized protein BCR38DRAFT_479809 [Pseudomassariella vexata]|uniref:Chromo domain-containing protein n=1 Tax=Pseudomassariella vexata TaxID=1141098 RepID=A0A1Y2EKD8_9PEZI|nr:uncharacterized protein BCR38DRAFT_479809 [Pseudomassariella vexata]ORY71305.1 hypothetical protein BCR38DRAFT_479809 [Pseudomassariella vexata]